MNFILIIIYEMTLWVLALLALPKMLYQLIRYHKYRESLLSRFGFYCPDFTACQGSSIWIHAVSMGETKAIVALARELKQRYPSHSLIISSVTETGHMEAKRSLPFADYHIYLPFDFYWIVTKIVKKAAPSLVLLCESDFWFNFLSQSKKQGAILALVNGKLSEQSMRHFGWAPFFTHPLFNLFDLLGLQNQLYRTRLMQIGAPMEKMVVTGNLKLDEDYPQLTKEEIKEWRQKLGIQCQQLVLTIGSTHYPEEQSILDVLKEVWQHTPQLRVILVPRHPERFKEVANLLDKERLNWISFKNISRRTGKEQVILLDVMGMLRMCYQLSDFALVGGSFTSEVGGHNILEPCWYEKPVLFGPYMHKQTELVQLMKQHGAGCQITLVELTGILKEWIENPLKGQEVGSKGKKLIQTLRGSTERTLQALEPFLCKQKTGRESILASKSQNK